MEHARILWTKEVPNLGMADADPWRSGEPGMRPGNPLRGVVATP